MISVYIKQIKTAGKPKMTDWKAGKITQSHLSHNISSFPRDKLRLSLRHVKLPKTHLSQLQEQLLLPCLKTKATLSKAFLSKTSCLGSLPFYKYIMGQPRFSTNQKVTLLTTK